MKQWAIDVGNLFSQAINLLLVRPLTFWYDKHCAGADEPVSGRVHRLSRAEYGIWPDIEDFIDFAFIWREEDHCRRSYERDIELCERRVNFRRHAMMTGDWRQK